MFPSPSTPSNETVPHTGGESSFFAHTPFGYVHGIVTLATFLGCWGYAIALWGWFVGLGLGWIPALVISGIVAFFFPLAVFLAFIAIVAGGVLVFLWLA